MWTLILFCVLTVSAEEDFRIIKLDSGLVRGDKYWNGDYYEFYGIPYATAPKGRDKFKAPLPVTPWDDLLTASNNNIRCHQCYYTDQSEDDIILDGEEDCLIMNVLVPALADENNLTPVVVYIHSGAFSGGSGNMAKFEHLANHDIVVVSFNYRVGALGFACLGNEEIPGNAALKDQVTALRWIKKNIRKFGGDPDKITLAGFSVGAAMAEILALSKATDGLFNQLILESGSALSPFTINRDPISTAWNIAKSIGYNGTESIEELTEFYLNVDIKDLALKSLNFFLPNSTFGFAPCIENIQSLEAIVTESPLDTLKKGDFNKIPVITGFSNMEGISRSIKFGSWREEMNENFADFLPADLHFKTEDIKKEVIKDIKKYYFNDNVINHESLQKYINYFSDAMFKYWIMKSAKLHASLSDKPVYLYEFSYVGNLNIQHNYMDRIKGASHRDQTAYILDFYGYTTNYRDLTTRDRMTTMWSDFVKYGNPTEFESSILTVKWPPYTNESPNYLEINRKLQVKQGILIDEYNFWNKIYEKHYWNPSAVKPELIIPKTRESSKTNKISTKIHEKPLESKATDKNKEDMDINNTKEKDKIKTSEIKDSEELLNNGDKLDDMKSSQMIRTTTKIKIGDDGKLIKEIIKDNNVKVIKLGTENNNIHNTPDIKQEDIQINSLKDEDVHTKTAELQKPSENKVNEKRKRKSKKTNYINTESVQVKQPDINNLENDESSKDK